MTPGLKRQFDTPSIAVFVGFFKIPGDDELRFFLRRVQSGNIPSRLLILYTVFTGQSFTDLRFQQVYW